MLKYRKETIDICDVPHNCGVLTIVLCEFYNMKLNFVKIAFYEVGMPRAHAEHTYRHRLELLLATLAGAAQGFPLPTISYRIDHAQ